MSRFLERSKTTSDVNFHEEINSSLSGGNVFQQTGTIFEIIQDIIRTNVLTKVHEDWTMNVTFRDKFPAPDGHVFHTKNGTIFKLVQDIIGTNLLTKFHKNRTIIVASRLLTRKNAPSPGAHVFQPTGTLFVPNQDIIGTNLLTKFNDDRTINVASRVFNIAV
ncbi:hypothetical protein DPMN_054182 [Dreissena polymorpha]|uniref:Uncharacterized protein n=1 Tax=Dreissena polymorpha TaxID=45954 RepID=A0A9D4HRE1_DREPO|nr:hypothetical protein DPMN_054182 [Dreissena polymorpha]